MMVSPTSDLKQKTIKSLVWSATDNIGVQLLQFIITVVMARQLFPEQYGLIAMLVIFMDIAQAFVESGFGSALIQKPDTTQVHYSSVFYFNFLMGCIMAGILCLLSPFIARFYNQPILIGLTCFMSLNLIINSCASVQTNLMVKTLNFKNLTKVSFGATVLSGIIGIILAFQGFGVWSLAVQSVSAILFRTVFLWLLNRWRPSRVFSLTVLKELFAYGSRLLAAGLLDVIFGNLYYLVIGKIFSARDLGFYTQANRVKQMPAGSISAIVSKVTFPVFALLQSEPDRFRSALQKSVTFLGLVNFPLMIGLAVVAEPMIMVLFTEKWALAIPYLQLLCMVGLLYPLQVINLNVLKATGRSDLFFRLEVIKKLITVVNIVICFRWGLLGLIYGQIVGAVISYWINSYYTGDLIGYDIREQVMDSLPYLLAAAAMGAIVLVIPRLADLEYLPLLVLQVVSGVLIYGGLCWCFKLKAFMEAIDIFTGTRV